MRKENVFRQIANSMRRMFSPEEGRDRIEGALYSYFCEFDAEELIDRMAYQEVVPSPRVVTNFLGVKISPEVMPSLLEPMVGCVESKPAPGNWHADIAEWAAALRSVMEAKDDYRIIEVGCGWGCWLNNMGVVARRLGLKLDLIGIEGDSRHLESARKTLALNSFNPMEFRLVKGVAAPRSGIALFPSYPEGHENWGAEPIFYPDEITKQRLLDEGSYEELSCIPLAQLCQQSMVDLLHIDIQGAELDFVRENFSDIAAHVRRVFIGTHSRYLEGCLIDLFLERGWRQEMDRAVVVDLQDGKPRTLVDGVLLFKNPDLI